MFNVIDPSKSIFTWNMTWEDLSLSLYVWESLNCKRNDTINIDTSVVQVYTGWASVTGVSGDGVSTSLCSVVMSCNNAAGSSQCQILMFMVPSTPRYSESFTLILISYHIGIMFPAD